MCYICLNHLPTETSSLLNKHLLEKDLSSVNLFSRTYSVLHAYPEKVIVRLNECCFRSCFRDVVSEVFCEKDVLKNFVKFAGKHMYRVSFNKLTGLRPTTLLKKRLWHK